MSKIDFDKMDWGSLTNQFKRSKIPDIADLKEFSNYIEKHPEKFHTKTLKRARFYNNVISKKGKGCGNSREVAPAPAELIDLTELSIAELQGYLDNLIQQREDAINAILNITPFANPNTSPHIISLNNEIARVRAEIQERQAETKDGMGLNPLVPFHTLEYGKVVGSHSAPPIRRYSRPYKKKKYPPNYMNPWIAFVKAFAAKHSLKYSDAIKDPRCKAEYAKKKTGKGSAASIDKMLGVVKQRKITYGIPSSIDEGRRRINNIFNSPDLTLEYKKNELDVMYLDFDWLYNTIKTEPLPDISMKKNMSMLKTLMNYISEKAVELSPDEYAGVNFEEAAREPEPVKKANGIYGTPSKTHRGEKDYTTKKGDKYYHQQHHLVAGTPYTKKLGKGNSMVDKFISNAYNQTQLGANGGRKFISL